MIAGKWVKEEGGGEKGIETQGRGHAGHGPDFENAQHNQFIDCWPGALAFQTSTSSSLTPCHVSSRKPRSGSVLGRCKNTSSGVELTLQPGVHSEESKPNT